MLKKRYERPQLVAAGQFRTATAGFGRRFGDQLVGRKSI